MEDVGDEDEVVFGAGRIEDFSWKQLLDIATCTECGRCQSQCPAWNTGKPLSPKLLIMDLRDNMFASADRIMQRNRAAGVEVENAGARRDRPGRAVVAAPPAVRAWSSARWTSSTSTPSSTCAATRCSWSPSSRPRPASCSATSRTRATRGASVAPSGPTGSQSLDFEVPVVTGTIPDDIEYLYWVGCAGALDERARKGAQATARMLHRAGVTLRASSARRSRARAIRRGASATSTSTRSRRCRTSRR